MKYIKPLFENDDDVNLVKALNDLNSEPKNVNYVIELIKNHKDLINTRSLSFTPLGIVIHTLHHNIYINDYHLAKVLIDAGADVNLPIDNSGKVPLYSAVLTENLNIIKLLIENGAKINIGYVGINKQKKNVPLILAAIRYSNSNNDEKNKLLQIIYYLIEKGADWSASESSNADRDYSDFIDHITSIWMEEYNEMMSDYIIRKYPEEYQKYLKTKKAKKFKLL